jgi:hypothetical protein
MPVGANRAPVALVGHKLVDHCKEFAKIVVEPEGQVGRTRCGNIGGGKIRRPSMF